MGNCSMLLLLMELSANVRNQFLAVWCFWKIRKYVVLCIVVHRCVTVHISQIWKVWCHSASMDHSIPNPLSTCTKLLTEDVTVWFLGPTKCMPPPSKNPVYKCRLFQFIDLINLILIIEFWDFLSSTRT